MNYLKTIKGNAITTAIVSIICFLILINSNILDNAGMASFIVMWLPLVIGIMTFILYLLARFVSKKNAHWLTILGNVLNVVFLIMSFIDKMNQ